MSLTRAIVLLGLLTASAHAQITTRPTSVVAGTVVRRAGPDLVIDNVDAILLPGLGSNISVAGTTVRVTGLLITARVTNVGTERWASEGSVALTLRFGLEGDPIRQGASVVPATNAMLGGAQAAAAAAFGPFRAVAPVPGSIGPGEFALVFLAVGDRSGHTTVIFQRDKYYTLDATVTAGRDANIENNRSLRVGRFNADHGRLVTQWEPISYRSSAAGTVQVNAPPRP
jgi:hypothetical protein